VIYIFFGFRLIAHFNRFNNHDGPFGASTSDLLKTIDVSEKANKQDSADITRIDVSAKAVSHS